MQSSYIREINEYFKILKNHKVRFYDEKIKAEPLIIKGLNEVLPEKIPSEEASSEEIYSGEKYPEPEPYELEYPEPEYPEPEYPEEEYPEPEYPEDEEYSSYY